MVPLLTVRNLSMQAKTASGPIDILKNIDLDLNEGEVVGLIGESGAGKSTLGLATMGYARRGCSFTEGSVRFRGQELLHQPTDSLRMLRGQKIAYVAQSAAASFNPAFRLIRQVVESPVIHKVMGRKDAETAAHGLFEKVQLPSPVGFGLRFPHQVSGGQLQRAMTAMAMVSRPDLIIFDEPTTALDVTTQLEVLLAIKRIVRDYGTAALYISHDLAVVAQLADRIKVMRYGEEIEEGPAAEVVEVPKMDYTRTLWSVRQFEKQRHADNDAKAPVLEVENLYASYGAVDVLADISVSLKPGKTLALVGESGSGKSTLARCVAGLLKPRQGIMTFDGATLPPEIAQRTTDLARQIQIIHQSADTALNPRQTIGTIVSRPAQRLLGRSAAAARAEANDMLRCVGLEPEQFMERYPGQLSGGQKQRVAIARALIAEPKIIICDEITSALDQVVAEGILKLLDTLQGETGLAYLYITHDIDTVRAIADDVAVMYQGRIVRYGPKPQVLSPPFDDYTQKLLNSVPEMRRGWLENAASRL